MRGKLWVSIKERPKIQSRGGEDTRGGEPNINRDEKTRNRAGRNPEKTRKTQAKNPEKKKKNNPKTEQEQRQNWSKKNRNKGIIHRERRRGKESSIHRELFPLLPSSLQTSLHKKPNTKPRSRIGRRSQHRPKFIITRTEKAGKHKEKREDSGHRSKGKQEGKL
ncbi:hypothetical protein NC651_023578 [Populus alba x Populus x berolinensis]|nr:hypothetical protein NC651_023578 [Populus alba x Populus x berolinensis]